MEIGGKVAVVTGGARGIGLALAQQLKAEGASGLLLADREAVVREAAQSVGGVAFEADLRQPAEVERMIKTAEKEFGRVDIVCSNAGIFCADGARNDLTAWNATDGSLADWQASWDINVMAHVHAARAALPGMLERGEGYFLHTASAAGLLSQIGSAIYSTTKHAAIGFAESLAIAHGDKGIGVSVLCPQAVRTPMLGGTEGESSAAATDGVIEPGTVAEVAVQGIKDEQFLLLPHAEVGTYWPRKSADYDRWLRGMRRFRDTLKQ